MSKESFRVSGGSKESGEDQVKGVNRDEPKTDVSPSQVPALELSAELKGRVIAALDALEDDAESIAPVLEPVIPPPELIRRVFEKIDTLDMDARGSAAIVRHNSEGRPVDRAVKVTKYRRALVTASLGFALLWMAVSAVALWHVLMMKRDAEFQALAAIKLEQEARAAEREAQKRLAELKAKEQQRQQAFLAAEKAREELSATNARLQRSNDELTSALRKAMIAREQAAIAQEHAGMNAKAARLAEQEALLAVEELRQRLSTERERLSFVERQLGELVTSLK
jgi:hypothetical protein